MQTNKPTCTLLAAFAVGAAFAFAQAPAAAQSSSSDSDNVTVNIPGWSGGGPIAEGTTQSRLLVPPVGAPLRPPGFVVFYEPDGKTVSDLLLSPTGTSIQVLSDPLTVAVPPGAVPYTEGPNGLQQDVSAAFGLPAGSIIMTSDGNVPDPTSTLGLLGFALVGIGGLRRWLRLC